MRSRGYGQFCPVAKAAEVVCGRWTPLVLRELLSGSARFNDLRRGVPLMSPALLSTRLKQLERAGVVERRAVDGVTEYRLTPSGLELRPLVEQLGCWGERWAQREVRREDLDPSLLMWDVRRRMPAEVLPAPRTVIKFQFSGVAAARRHWWLVAEGGGVDLCLQDPGHAVDLYVTGHIRTMVEAWLGRVRFDRLVRDGEVEVDGARGLIRAFIRAFPPAAPAWQHDGSTG